MTSQTEKSPRPQIEDAPGLTWRWLPTKGWEARWVARPAAVKANFHPKVRSIWRGHKPTQSERLYIAAQCTRLQDEMNVHLRGGIPQPLPGATIAVLNDLIESYRVDPDSNYRTVRYYTRQCYEVCLRRLARDIGDVPLSDMDGRFFMRWHRTWVGEKKQIVMAHSLVGMLRSLFAYGAFLLKGEEQARCKNLRDLLGMQRFKTGRPREQRLTSAHVNAIRAKAHEMGRPSVALAQALQFELMLRQKDVIGEWVPAEETTALSYVLRELQPHGPGARRRPLKWVYGLLWEEVDHRLTLRHTTSKRSKDVVFDLHGAKMVIEELGHIGVDKLPPRGPIIVNETTGLPYTDTGFKNTWRKIARAAGVPDEICNMDSRSGAISEAQAAGIPLDHIRETATHSDASQTVDYARAFLEVSRSVSKARAEYRTAQHEVISLADHRTLKVVQSSDGSDS